MKFFIIFFAILFFFQTARSEFYKNFIIAKVDQEIITKYDVDLNIFFEEKLADRLKLNSLNFKSQSSPEQLQNFKYLTIFEFLIEKEILDYQLIETKKNSEESEKLVEELKLKSHTEIDLLRKQFDLDESDIKKMILKKILIQKYFELRIGNYIKSNSDDNLKNMNSEFFPERKSSSDLKSIEFREKLLNEIKRILKEMKKKYSIQIY